MKDPTPREGRLIAICGIDGSGKATQADLLARRAVSEGRAAKQVSFPRYGQGLFAELIERYLRGEFAAQAADVSPYLVALPYACDRWEAAPQLREWLAKGHLVVCNRYVPATLAHQGCKIAAEGRQAFFDWVAELEYGVFALPRPDLHVLLDVPPRVTMRLLRERDAIEGRSEGPDIHERDFGHLDATAGVYRQLAAAEPGEWALIQCVEAGQLLPPEQIADSVWAEVRRVL